MYILPSVLPRRSAKLLFAECLRLGTRQRLTPLVAVTSWCSFAECSTLSKIFFVECFFCLVYGTRQRRSSPCVFLCQVQHSAKRLFAECPIFCTRQSSGHLAKTAFSAVTNNQTEELRAAWEKKKKKVVWL
jgi:hypothetical protein